MSNMWRVIEHFSRTDELGFEHYIAKTAEGYKLTITKVGSRRSEFDFSTAAEAQSESLVWSAAEAKRLEEERAEVRTWPRMTTKTVRADSWDERSKFQVELKKHQPKFGEQKTDVYLDGEFLGVTLQDVSGRKEPWRYLTPKEIDSDAKGRLHWRRHASQANAIRRLLDAKKRRDYEAYKNS